MMAKSSVNELKITNSKLNSPFFLLFSIVLIIYLLLTFYSQKYILTEGMYFSSLQTQMSYEQIEAFLKNQAEWSWLGYVFIPILYLLKIILVAFTLYIIKVIMGKGFSATFKELFIITLKADMIFLIPAIIKVTWFTFYPASSLEEVQYFMPGSVFQLFEGEEIVPWLMYPLQAFSIWEVGFWFLLAYQLKEFFDNDFGRSFQNVMLSYGSGFLIWVVFVVFLSLNLS